MASFAAIGLLSIPPTMALLRWRKTIQTGFAISAAGCRRGAAAASFSIAEVALLALVVVFAAAMARYGAV